MQLYNQTTKYTCAAASLAMVINHFKPEFNLNIANEFDLWQNTAALPTRGSSIYAWALYAKQKGVPLQVVVGKREYKFPGYKFKAYKKKEIDIANVSSELFYRKAKEQGINIDEREFNISEVKRLLVDGKILLLRLIIGVIRRSKENKRNPHYMLVYKYENGNFLIMDPKKGRLKIDENIVEQAFDKVTDIRRDHRMIIFG